MKIVINGIPGVGKSTVASALATELALPHIPERFSGNPYLNGTVHPLCPSLVTNFQLTSMKRDYYLNKSGVFEVSPQAAREIFVPRRLHHRLSNYTEDLTFDFDFFLWAPLHIIEERIKKRARPGLLEQELEAAHVRHIRSMRVRQSPSVIVINANQPVINIIQDILRYINA